ncbi:MAG: choice-of-anchor D domain-containing protein [Terriglobales bacterium]
MRLATFSSIGRSARIISLLTLVLLLAGCQGLAGGGQPAARGTVSANPPSLSFGNVTVGTSSSLRGSLKAAGAAVTVSSASSTSAEFAVSGITLTAVLDAGQSLPFTVTFTPQVSGTATATLSFVSNAANSPSLESLSGDGASPPPHRVDLTWDPSQSLGVIGYNVYRGDQAGGPYSRINNSLDASTSYTDDAVSAGATYFYVVTAMDDNGLESGYSGHIKAKIPAP